MRTKDVASYVSTESESMIRIHKLEKERSEARLPSPPQVMRRKTGYMATSHALLSLARRFTHKVRRECHDVLS